MVYSDGTCKRKISQISDFVIFESKNKMMNKKMEEKQKFTQWWLWLILLGIGMVPLIGLYKQVVLKQLFGDNPMSDFGLIVFSLFIFIIIVLFLFMKLETKITEQGIRVRFIPFVEKKIGWNEIKNIEIIEHSILSSGIRISLKFGTVYKVSGNYGLFIELNNGEKILIGTQMGKEIKEFIDVMNKTIG